MHISSRSSWREKRVYVRRETKKKKHAFEPRRLEKGKSVKA